MAKAAHDNNNNCRIYTIDYDGPLAKKMKDTLMQSKLNMETLSRELTTAADIIVKKLDDGSDK